MVHGKEISVRAEGFSDIRNLTEQVEEVIGESRVRNGVVGISVIGSTASITTIEFEPALVEDMKEKLEEIASRKMKSRHSETWGDDNGFSHLRASLMGPGICLPVRNGKLLVGTWQQVVLIDHDNAPRERRVYIQVVGE